MNKLTYSILLFLCSSLSVLAQDSIKELLTGLDNLLTNANYYMKQKEDRLSRLKIQLIQETYPEKQYELCYRIVNEYKSYMSDSALVYIGKNLELAQKYDNSFWLINTQLQYSFVLSSSGLFIESETLLNSIPREKISQELLVEYYKCFELLYVNVNIYQAQQQLIKNYPEIIRNYRDSILINMPKENLERYYYKFVIADSENDLTNAEEYLTHYVSTLFPGTHEHAKKNYNMALLCEKTDRKDLQVNYLIESVSSDIKDAVKENRALLDLSIWLYDHGDIERAFKYIIFALNDANFYNARFRYFEISEILPIITTAYQKQNLQQSSRLQYTIIIISVLLIILLVTILFLYKQMLALKSTRKRLNETNLHLESVNNKLNSLNQELSEANLIKEEYLGHFLDLCSEYIAVLQNYKKQIKNKLAAKRFDELLKMVSYTGKEDEIKNLYINFDKAFLKIYPGFVDSLNGLLKKEFQYHIKKEELLNTELRILALIRIGITDSAQIASFLRCTVQTIYNYRSKIRKNTLIEGDDIEEKIREIGRVHI